MDARGRIHQALIYLAELRDTKEVKFKEKESELAKWNPAAGDSVPSLEKRVDQCLLRLRSGCLGPVAASALSRL